MEKEYNMGVNNMAESSKQFVDVVIGGRIFKLAASENPDYIKKIADYIDNKLRQLNVSAASNIMNDDHFAIILALNIADDMFKSSYEGEDVKSPTPEEQRQIAELKNQLMTKINDYDLLSNQFKAKSDEVDGLKDTIYANEDNITRLNSKVEYYKTQLDDSNKTVESKSQYIIDLTKKINDKNQELNNLSKKLADKNTALNELNQKSAERNIKLNNVNKERDELAVKLKAANNNIKSLEKDIEALKLQHTGEMSSLRTMHSDEVAQMSEKISELKHTNMVLSEDSAALKSEFDKFKIDLENTTDGQLKAAFAKTKAENIELRRTIEELKTQIAKGNQ